MATRSEGRELLQPALLDRLTDERSEAGSDGPQADGDRFFGRTALRRAVIRDLGWLFNATQPLLREEAEAYPAAARSVLNFGLPALAGQATSEVEVTKLERTIRGAIIDFEPRIIADSITVKAIESEDVLLTHNVIEFEIRGQLWTHTGPLDLLLRTQLDLEAGKVQVHDLRPGSAAAENLATGR